MRLRARGGRGTSEESVEGEDGWSRLRRECRQSFFNALKESEIETCKIGSLDVENEDIEACPQTIHLNYGNPVSTTAFLKCYLGSTDDFLRMSLGHDGFFIGEGGLAFREDRKTRLFRSTKTFTHIGDVDEMVCDAGDE